MRIPEQVRENDEIAFRVLGIFRVFFTYFHGDRRNICGRKSRNFVKMHHPETIWQCFEPVDDQKVFRVRILPNCIGLRIRACAQIGCRPPTLEVTKQITFRHFKQHSEQNCVTCTGSGDVFRGFGLPAWSAGWTRWLPCHTRPCAWE